MARFYGSMSNSRGNEVTAQSPGYAHIRGWHLGVKVVPTATADNEDVFDIWMTGGSNGHSPSRYVGRVILTEDGPVFKAADKPHMTRA